MIRLIATDLDGTLLRSDKTISKETRELLSSLYDKDILFVPSTGRTHAELPEAVMQVEHLRYAITCNGGGVYDFENQKYIYNFTIQKDIGERVLKFCESLPVYPTMVCDGNRYIRTEEDGKVAQYIIDVAAPGIVEKAQPVSDLVNALRETEAGLQKVFLYSKGPELTQDVLTTLIREFPELCITTSGPLYVEINAGGIDKGKTLVLLCEHLGISVEDSVAFGDAANDLEMLKSAGRAVVPENGTDEARALADIICESCDDDGVRKAVMRLTGG